MMCCKRGERPYDFYDWAASRPELYRAYQQQMMMSAHNAGADVMKQVRLPKQARSLLDVGGAHGSYSILFCQQHPNLQATILDSHAGAQMAQENIAHYHLQNRVQTVLGDLWETEWGEGHDIILLFNLIPHFDAKGKLDLPQKAAALQPGGRTGMILKGPDFQLAGWINVMPGTSYEEKETSMAPGECVLLYSDGLVEAHNRQREMFGFPRLQELMATHANGDTLNLNMPGGAKLSTGVRVIYADDESFSFITPQGHMFAGMITFSDSADGGAEGGVTVIQIQGLIRASDPMYETTFRLGFGHKAEDKFWFDTLCNLAAHFGSANRQLTLTAVCVDKKVQWSEAGNIWHNAAIRLAIYLPVHLTRRLFIRKDELGIRNYERFHSFLIPNSSWIMTQSS